MREVPYSTTEDESEYCGHIWRQRCYSGGPWGFAWDVLEPGGEYHVARGWQETQEAAEAAMHQALEKYQ